MSKIIQKILENKKNESMELGETDLGHSQDDIVAKGWEGAGKYHTAAKKAKEASYIADETDDAANHFQAAELHLKAAHFGAYGPNIKTHIKKAMQHLDAHKHL